MNGVKRKWVAIAFIPLAILVSSCSKSSLLNKPAVLGDLPLTVPLLDTSKIRKPRVPFLPIDLLPIVNCIDSYQDLVTALDSPIINIQAVVLANGVTIFPRPDWNVVRYQAIVSQQSNSLFDSRLLVEWRYPDGNWQASTEEVWSLGCVYEQNGRPPYTNIIKGTDTLIINTSFYWPGYEYTGEHIDYLIAATP